MIIFVMMSWISLICINSNAGKLGLTARGQRQATQRKRFFKEPKSMAHRYII